MKKVILLTLLSVNLFGQSLNDDLKRGLYQPSPDWIVVHQLVADTIFTFQLQSSKIHFDQVAPALFDSIPKIYTWEGRERIKREVGFTDMREIDEKHTLFTYDQDSLFNVLHFIKKEDLGYEYYFSKHRVAKVDLAKSIHQDTTDYFKFTAFTLDDIKQLKSYKDFTGISKTEFDSLLDYVRSQNQILTNQLNNNEDISMYGSLENNEIVVKILLHFKYNPFIFPGVYTKVYKKHTEN
uniref:hypothetical protein n=2 Tax=Roseivirga sp. TaxID=1964215 RepID=UPI0040478D10